MHRLLLRSSPVDFYGTPRERDVYERVLACNTPPEAIVTQYEVDAAYFWNDLMRGGRGEWFPQRLDAEVASLREPISLPVRRRRPLRDRRSQVRCLLPRQLGNVLFAGHLSSEEQSA